MKLLVISLIFPNSEAPLKGIFVLRQLEALANTGVEIKVVAPVAATPWLLARLRKKWRKYRAVEKQKELNGITTYYPRYFRPPGRFFRPYAGASMYFSLYSYLHKLNEQFPFDAILANGLTPDGELALRLGKKLNVPAYCYAMGSDILLYPKESKNMHRLSRRTLSQLNGIISHGNELKREIFRLEPGTKHVKSIYRGCNLHIFRPDCNKRKAIRHLLNVDKNQILCLFSGNIVRTKGIVEILTVFKNIFKKRQDVMLILCGAQPDKKLRNEVSSWIIENGFEKCAIMQGPVPHEQIPGYLNAADIFLFPSWQEGLPNAVIEAAACRLPIVGTSIPGVLEILGDAGSELLFPPKDINAFKGILSCLLDSQEKRKKYADLAFERVQTNFDVATNIHHLKNYIFPTWKQDRK